MVGVADGVAGADGKVKEDLVTSSLYEVFEELPDPRSPLGRRHPLAAILSQATVAMLGGARSLETIAQFGRDRGPRFARALGFTRDEMPCKATFHNVFKVLDAGGFERALARWLRGRWRRSITRRKRRSGRCASTARPTSTKRHRRCWM